jgi:hypothetical protein
MGFLGRLLLGSGELRPELRAQLAEEGLVLIAERLSGSLRYDQFRMPGRRFNGKVTGVRVGLGISEKRFVIYGRSGRLKLADSAFDSPHLDMVEMRAAEPGRLELHVDYDKSTATDVSGRLAIRVNTPDAERIAAELNGRLGRTPSG